MPNLKVNKKLQVLEAEEAALNSLKILRLVAQFHRIERARAKEHCGKKLKRT
jgi:hypothetical protein